MWILERPGMLLLLFAVPVAFYLRHIWRGRGGRIVFPFHVWRGAGFTPESRVLSVVNGIAVLCFWAGSCALIVALAGPAAVTRERVYLNRGIDIMIVLDESPSMAAEDMAPNNRFDAARDIIRQFVEKRQNDAVGLVGFGSEAALRVPPTLDHAAFERALSQLKILELGDGTAIGVGLSVAVLHLERSTAPQKVIILLTDGENNQGEIPPETAAQVAAEKGIKVFTIGLGRSDEVPIEYTDPKTGKTYRGTYKGGFDDSVLRSIAATTGATYFAATSEGALAAVFRSIDSIETVERRVRIQVHTYPRYKDFILLGLGLILFDFSIRRWMLREVL